MQVSNHPLGHAALDYKVVAKREVGFQDGSKCLLRVKVVKLRLVTRIANSRL